MGFSLLTAFSWILFWSFVMETVRYLGHCCRFRSII